MKRRGGGTGSYKRPEQGNAYTAKTLTGLVGDGEQHQIGSRKIGPRRGETRNVGNAPIRAPDTGSKGGPTPKDDAQKSEDEEPLIKRS